MFDESELVSSLQINAENALALTRALNSACETIIYLVYNNQFTGFVQRRSAELVEIHSAGAHVTLAVSAVPFDQLI